MKQMFIIGLIVIIGSTQTTVKPTTQACECANLLSQADCNAKIGCTWQISTTTNSKDNTITQTQGIILIDNQGTCSITKSLTYCSYVSNEKLCAKTIGCSFHNKICTIFAGCSAYVQTTNAGCQAISTQCTTDGTRCISPQACSAYTTKALCSENVSKSGAKSCTWIDNGTSGTCNDKFCSDAPATYTTQSQCTGWIAGCLANGKGCATTLGLCSSYTQANGCSGMIGSDGPCTINTSQGSTVCRPLECSDAATQLGTNEACSAFLAGCHTTGKGCVLTLQPCSSYQQTQGCVGLIGIDGPCFADTINSTVCRALVCTDAPTSISKDSDCVSFLVGCFTTGQGCTSSLGLCSSYTGTILTCSLYVGSDGNCSGTSITTGSCSARTCEEAPTTTKTDEDCEAFQTGCITNGLGCVKTLGLCRSYLGTNTTCKQYIGSDGNCTAPQSQTSPADCAVKACSEAPNNTSCQTYSYKCVANGNGCVEQTSCELTSSATICQGFSSCISNQTCLNKSECQNYLDQQSCLQNQQQYSSGGIIYPRACEWSGGACSNLDCGSLPTFLSTDEDCDHGLSGCLTNGGGCLDINEGCGSYKGLTATCLKFKGINKTQLCTQSNTVTDQQTACVAKTSCSQAQTHSLKSVTYSSNETCQQFLSGCFNDGKGNCTQGDCTTYFGLNSFCEGIQTALSGTSIQYCWKSSGQENPATACEKRQCQHAKGTSFTSNTQCDTFLKGCFWNGLATGGCLEPTTACAQYLGTQQQCAQVSESNKICTQGTRYCRQFDCSQKSPPQTANNGMLKAKYCQGFIDVNGNNCYMGSATCAKEATNCTQFVAIGDNKDEKLEYCYGLRYPGIGSKSFCGYIEGGYCTVAKCDQFKPSGANANDKAISCQNLNIDGKTKCGLATSQSAFCSERKCSDYGSFDHICESITQCKWDPNLSICFRNDSCESNIIPEQFNTFFYQKAEYCSHTNYQKLSASGEKVTLICGYDIKTDSCILPKDKCTDIKIPDSTITNQDRANFCATSNTSSGDKCAYSVGSTTCVPKDTCDKYIPYEVIEGKAPPDAVQSQKFCSTLTDQSGYVCGFASGTAKCQVLQNSCQSYNTYGATISENQKFCSKLKAKGYFCASNTAGSSNCKEPDCKDVSSGQNSQTCQDYNIKCLFDGQICVEKQELCSNYIAHSNGAQFLNCSSLIANEGKCGWTVGDKCEERKCSQLFGDAANVQSCIQYNDCLYDGSSCVEWEDDCTSYIPSGETDQIKASICNSMLNTPFEGCTYMVGTSTCITTNDSCNYDKPDSATTVAAALAACTLAQDSKGKKCGYSSQLQKCSARKCDQVLSPQLDSDCTSYANGCDLDPYSPCASTECSNAPKDITKNEKCEAYRTGCITNGGGCIEDTECSNLKGTQAICNGFTGKNIPCTNTSTASSDDPCKDKTCQMNTTAKNDPECATWYPTKGLAKCVWGGSSGCVPQQPCAQFTGTIDTCPKVTATNGLCHGTSNQPAACVANTSNCSAAPNTYITDTQCKSWGSTCMTNGSGCISINGATCSSFLTPLACPLYKSTPGLFCDLVNECKTKPTPYASACSDYTSASECNNIPLLGSTKITCSWDVTYKICVPLTCELLPAKLKTDGDCNAIISTCTTNGAGCITKGACSTYPKQACGPAATTDTQKACIWGDSACRPIACTDNTNATSDNECNTFLAGCKTTGAGCAETLTCSVFINQLLCLSDSTGYPCLWYKASASAAGKCINYSQCSDIISPSHAECQAASPLCTTNGKNCIAITGCSKTLAQASCVIGTDGNCGWLPATGSTPAACTLFTNCQEAKGTKAAECEAWGSTCIFDGNSCISKSTCSSYGTQIACKNLGTDGSCFWVAPTDTTTQGICRQLLCSDATTNTSTHSGCVSFSASTACTTSGTACIAQAPCSTYKLESGCVQGTDGICIWVKTTSTSTCRVKLCTDIILTTSDSCANAISGVKCVSSGVNCIAQSACSTYTSKEACLGGGTDGTCLFIPGQNSSETNQGICQQFSSCANANSDKTACNSRSDVCYFEEKILNGVKLVSCQPHTCATKARGSSCQPVPSWDLSTYQICVVIDSKCSPGSPTALTAQQCYSQSVGTYSWSDKSKLCTACAVTTPITTNTTNTTNSTNSTDNTSTVSNTNTTFGYLISIISIVLFI